jgi:hypothetical protein
VNGVISYDQITRFLVGEELDGKALWFRIKKLVHRYEIRKGCLIFDDTIIEKTFMDENEIVCRYYDHSKGRSVKGLNILTAFYMVESEYGTLRVPIDYQIVPKTKVETDKKSGKERRVSEKTKNEMIERTIQKHVKFGYILADSWFSSGENMRYIGKNGKKFIIEVKERGRNVICQARSGGDT